MSPARRPIAASPLLRVLALGAASSALALAALAGFLRWNEPGAELAPAVLASAGERASAPHSESVTRSEQVERETLELEQELEQEVAPSSPEQAALPLAAAGVVRDARGRPIAEASVTGELAELGSKTWSTRSNASGRFALRVPDARGRLALRAHHAQHGKVELANLGAGSPAALALELVLAPSATLEGEARLPLGVAATAVRAELHADGEPLLVPLDAGGRFAVRGIQARRAELRWRGPSRFVASGMHVQLGAVERFELAPGETTALAQRDLSGALVHRNVQLRDTARDSALARRELWLVSAGADAAVREQVLRCDDAGAVAFACEADAERIALAVPGFRIHLLPCSAGTQTLEVDLVPPFEVDLPIDLPAEAPARRSLRAVLERRGGDALLARAIEAAIGGTAPVWRDVALRVLLPLPGPYRVQLFPPEGPAIGAADFDVDDAGALTR